MTYDILDALIESFSDGYIIDHLDHYKPLDKVETIVSKYFTTNLALMKVLYISMSLHFDAVMPQAATIEWNLLLNSTVRAPEFQVFLKVLDIDVSQIHLPTDARIYLILPQMNNEDSILYRWGFSLLGSQTNLQFYYWGGNWYNSDNDQIKYINLFTVGHPLGLTAQLYSYQNGHWAVFDQQQPITWPIDFVLEPNLHNALLPYKVSPNCETVYKTLAVPQYAASSSTSLESSP